MGLAWLSLFLLSGSGPGGPANEVPGQERDAQVDPVDGTPGFEASGDPEASRQVLREREAHLDGRIQEVRSSRTYTEEERERVLGPLQAERDRLHRFRLEYDRLGR